MEAIEFLKKIGVNKISDKTHIPTEEIQKILEFDFKAFKSPKAKGFIAILERDMGVDLSVWLEEYNNYLLENAETPQGVFLVPKEEDEVPLRKKIYIFLALIALIVFSVFVIIPILSNSSSGIKSLVEEKTVKEAKTKIKEQEIKEVENSVIVIDLNETEEKDLNKTLVQIENIEENSTKLEDVIVETKSKDTDEYYIQSKNDLWIGITDLDSGKKISKIFQGKFELEKDKNISIIFGHGFFKIIFADQIIDPDSKYIQKVKILNRVITNETENSPIENQNSSETNN